jgi:hypothetical protein
VVQAVLAHMSSAAQRHAFFKVGGGRRRLKVKLAATSCAKVVPDSD